jgi:hypothetical protein
MTDSGQNHEFAVTLALQGPNGLLTAASLKECKALGAVVSASQTGPPNFPLCGKGGEQPGVRVYSAAVFVEPVEARSSAGPVWRLRPSAQLIRPTWL